MDTIVRVLVILFSALAAYSMVSSERRSRGWSTAAALGMFAAVFGGVLFGLLHIWDWLSPKLTDSSPSENDLLVAGLVVVAAVVILALDLIGKIDIMSQVRGSMDRMNADRGGPSST